MHQELLLTTKGKNLQNSSCLRPNLKYLHELLRHANTAITLDTYPRVIPGMGDYAARLADALS